VAELGFGTFWLGGSPRLTALRPLLEATDEIVVASGIVNVWQYEPAVLAAEYSELVRDFPDRVLLGIGIGHPEATSDYRRPLRAMQGFLHGLDAASESVPVAGRCVAALGPTMLELAAERSLGAHPYFVPVDHTRLARDTIADAHANAGEVLNSPHSDHHGEAVVLEQTVRFVEPCVPQPLELLLDASEHVVRHPLQGPGPLRVVTPCASCSFLVPARVQSAERPRRTRDLLGVDEHPTRPEL
jgi:probable F420-dependent oxidoreductase